MQKTHAYALIGSLTALMALLLPGANTLYAWLGYLCMTLGALAVYRGTTAWCVAGERVIVLAAALLTLGVVANVHVFTPVGYSDTHPLLTNPDAARNYNALLYILGYGGVPMLRTHGLFQWVLAPVGFITHASITALLMQQAAMTMTSLVCAAVLARRAGLSPRGSALAMACAAAVCYFLASGVILVKDATVIAGIALTATAFTDKHRGWTCLTIFIIGAMLVSLARPQLCLAIPLGFLIITLGAPAGHRQVAAYLVAILVPVAMWVIPQLTDNAPDIDKMSAGVTVVNWVHPQQQAYFDIVGMPGEHSFWGRVLRFPVAMVSQFLIPFPWNFARDLPWGYSQAWAHFSYPWYYFGATAVFGAVQCIRRRRLSPIARLAFWGLVIWLAGCWVSAGTVSRYGLSAIPLIAPLVAWTLATAKRKPRTYIYYIVFFSLVLAVTLLVCHHLQMQYL